MRQSIYNLGRLSPKDLEIYSSLRVPDGPFFIRLDGWNFHSLAQRLGLRRPFDSSLASSLAETAKELLKEFNAALAYLFSDEINLLFLKFTLFNRRIEKINSILAGLASSSLYSLLKRRHDDTSPLSFDSRIIPVEGVDQIIGYLAWRQNEAYRNCYNAYAQHVLRASGGLSPKEAAERLRNLKVAQLRNLIEAYGINPERIPKWHFRGVVVYWESFERRGYDPVKRVVALAKRRRVKIDWSPPSFNSKEGRNILLRWIGFSLRRGNRSAVI